MNNARCGKCLKKIEPEIEPEPVNEIPVKLIEELELAKVAIASLLADKERLSLEAEQYRKLSEDLQGQNIAMKQAIYKPLPMPTGSNKVIYPRHESITRRLLKIFGF